MSLLVLSHRDVDQVIQSFSPITLETLMARVFHILSSQGDSPNSEATFLNPPRISMAAAHHTALFMPARIAHSSLSGTTCKIVCVPRGNSAGGLPGSTLVLDEDTGAVKAIVNSRVLTALRNAAGSLLSAHLSIPKDRVVRRLVVFGAGKQIEAHISLFCRAYSQIESCAIVNRSLNERAEELLTTMRQQHANVKFQLYSLEDTQAVQDILRDADVVICATSSTSPLFPSSWIKDGTHAILIGSYTPAMHEVDSTLIRRAVSAQSLIIDSWEACSTEAGELLSAKVTKEDVKEIGTLVSFPGDEPVYHNIDALAEESRKGFEGPISLFKSVGVGLQDVAITVAVVSQAEALGGLGQTIQHYDL